MSRSVARSMVTLLAVAVLAIAGVAVIMQSASASSEAGSPWLRYQLTGGSLEGVDAIAANDAWAVGSDGLLAHWNGTSWTAYDNTKLGPRLIYGVDMLSSSQVWASAGSGTMLRYDGANWVIEPTNLGTTSMFDVSMVSPTDGWAVGSSGTFGDYDGTSWQQVRPGGTLTVTLNGIDMVASKAGWAVGGASDQSGILGKIARYNGSAWVDDFSYNRILYDVDMLDTTYGWAVGQGGTLLEWNGSFWAAYTSPPSAAVNLQGVSVISRTNAWAVGARNGFSNDIWHWDGTNWTAVTTPNTAPLNDVFMLNSNEGWVVGERGTIYRYNGASFLIYNTHWTSNGFYGLDFLDPRDGWAVGVLNQSPPAYGLQHWNGTFWEEYQPPAFQPTLYDVDMVTTDAVWAVGTSGYIFKWNGTAWTRDTSPPSISLYSMSMLSTTDGWAAGGSGNIVHYDGTAWTNYTSPTTSNLWSIDMVNANEGWAGGISGLMLHYQNGTWTQLSPNPSGFTIEGIDMLSADEGWAVGYNGTILHYQNGTWTQQASPVTSNLLNVHMLSPNSGWAVGVAPTGANATILQYVSGTWNLVPNPTGRNMRDIFMFAANEGWTVGESPGTKLYMGPLGGPTATVTRTPTITPTPTPVTCYTISDTISSSDPVQTGMVTRTFSPSTCVFSPVCPGVADTTPRHYKAYTYFFPHGSFSTQCITVDISASGCPNSLYSVGYRGTFDPANVCTGWAGDTGDIVGSGSSYSFIVTRGSYFTIVVHEATPNAGCSNYVINIRTSLFCSEITTTTPTPTQTNTPGPSPTTTVTSSPTQTSDTPTPVVTTPTATPCPIQFTDVPVGHTFYDAVRCLACRGIVSGYSDGTFRPNNQVTRGQLAKMVSNAAGFSEDPNPQIFTDVPPSNTFYEWINRLTRRGHMTGYTCGGPGEPCINNMPYFRPSANATRGQTSKIVSNAAGFTETHTGQTFEDVPPNYIFYQEIERLASRGVMGGYPCGGPGEPCIAPENRPYFRPQNDVTRGQSAKIVANTFFPGCTTP